MSISKVRLPNNIEEDIKAKYLIQSSSSDAVSAEFSARTVTDDAIAIIQKIYGNTVKWNQLMDIVDGTYNPVGCPITVSNHKITLNGTATSGGGRTVYISATTVELINGHYYYAHNTVGVPYFITKNSSSGIYRQVSSSEKFQWTGTSFSDGGVGFNFTNNTTYNTSGYAYLVDLTVIYGSGNEPTVSEFEAQYPADYYPYDPGSFTSNSATAILSTGRNLFDEGAVFGSAQNISKVASGWSGAAGHFAAIGHIWENIFGYGGQICIYMKATADSSGGGFRPVFHYSDNTSSNGPVVGTSVDTYVVSSSGKVVSYIDLTYSSGRTIVIEKLCISYSDPTYDGTYEHYTEFHQIDLNIPTLTGKLNGAGSSVVIFPDGMGKVNSIVDELTSTTAKRMGVFINLGSITWTMSNGTHFYSAAISGRATGSANIICAKYSVISSIGGWSAFTNGNYNTVGIYYRSNNTTIGICTETSYTDAAAFTTAMNGIYMFTEIATPQEYILDNALQLQYPVVAGGTEMVLPTSGTAPMKMDVIYGNAADATSNLSSNFISVDSMKAFLNNLGTQMGGTWNMQYNNGKFEFTFSSS